MKTFSFILLFAFPIAAADPVGTVTLELKATVMVKKRAIQIDDVAELRGGSDELRERIARLDLGEAPAQGQTVAIRARQVEFRLRLADVPATQFRIGGASEVIVSPATERINEEVVKNAARDALVKRLPWPADDLSVRLVQPIVLKLPQVTEWETTRIKVEPHSPSVGLGRNQMDVTIFVNDMHRLSLPVFLEVRLLQKVAICRAPIRKGEVLTEKEIYADRFAVEPGKSNVLPYEEVIGRNTLRSIQPGNVIGVLDVDKAPTTEQGALIRTRQPVKMVVNLGSVTVGATGEALQDGRMGQTIRVLNVESKKVVTGRITGPNTVEVETGGKP